MHVQKTFMQLRLKTFMQVRLETFMQAQKTFMHVRLKTFMQVQKAIKQNVLFIEYLYPATK